MVRFSGIICPNVLQLPTFSGRRPRTDREIYELDMSKVQRMTEKLNGKPIRDSHTKFNIGRITRNWLQGNQWWVEFDIDHPEVGRDYVRDIRSGRLGSLSLQHWWNSLEPIEVSVCEIPMRPGSDIVSELCEHPEDCGSNASLYKENTADFLVSAAQTIEEASVLEISDMSSGSAAANGKDSKDTGMSLTMPGEDQDGSGEQDQKHHRAGAGGGGGGGGAAPFTPPSDSSQALQELGLPPPPPRPTSNGASSSLPSGAPTGGAMLPPTPRPSPLPQQQQQQVPQQHQPIRLRVPQQQQQPSGSKPQQPHQTKRGGDMDTEDDHTDGTKQQQQQQQQHEQRGKPVEQDDQKRREVLDKELVKKITSDSRIDSHTRNALYDLVIRNTSTMNSMKQEIQNLKKQLEDAQEKSKGYDEVTKTRRETVAEGFSTLLGAQGASEEVRKNVENYFRNSPEVQKLLNAGGDMLVSACATLTKHRGHVESMQAELDRRQALLDHVMSGGLESDFAYDDLDSKPRKSLEHRTIHKAKRTATGGSSSSGLGLHTEEVVEREGDDDLHMAAAGGDQKVSAGRSASASSFSGKEEKKEAPRQTSGLKVGWAPQFVDMPSEDIFKELRDAEDYNRQFGGGGEEVSVTVRNRSRDEPDARKRKTGW